MFLKYWNIRNNEIQELLPRNLRNDKSKEGCTNANQYLKENLDKMAKAIKTIEAEMTKLEKPIKSCEDMFNSIHKFINRSEEELKILYLSQGSWGYNFLMDIYTREPETLTLKQKAVLLSIAENINQNIWKTGFSKELYKKGEEQEEKQTKEEIEKIFINDGSELIDEFEMLYDNFDDVMKTKLYDHQIKTVNFLLTRENKNGIIASDTGMGKTLISMAYAEKIGSKTLIVCPLAMVDTWKREIKKHSIKKDLSKYQIINYEKILTLTFEDTENTLLILDEAHKIKNRFAKRTEILMSYKWQNVICLTATPYGNDANDLRSLFEITGYDSPINLEGNVNMKYLKKAMIRIKKDKLNLKPMHIIQVPLECENITEYREIENNIREEVEDSKDYSLVLTKMIRLLQYCSDRNMIMKNKTIFTENQKFKAILEKMEKHKDKPILIWGNSVETIEILHKELSEYTTCEFIHGGVKQKERDVILDNFREGKVQLLIANPKTLSAGITLVNTNIHIFYSRDFSIIERLQALGRSYRIGQDKEVYIYDLFYEGTLEEYVIETLEEKEKNLKDVLNNCMQIKDPNINQLKGYFKTNGQ